MCGEFTWRASDFEESLMTQTALRWGLINRTSTLEKLDQEIKKLADSILDKYYNK